MKGREYPAIFHKEGNGYWIELPDVEGCFSQANTIEEGIVYARKALELMLEDMQPPKATPIEDISVDSVDRVIMITLENEKER